MSMFDRLSEFMDFMSEYLSSLLSFLYMLLSQFFYSCLDLFFKFISDTSGNLAFIGRSTISTFDFIPFNENSISEDFIYVIVGLIVLFFIFRLVWILIMNIISALL